MGSLSPLLQQEFRRDRGHPLLSAPESYKFDAQGLEPLFLLVSRSCDGGNCHRFKPAGLRIRIWVFGSDPDTVLD